MKQITFKKGSIYNPDFIKAFVVFYDVTAEGQRMYKSKQDNTYFLFEEYYRHDALHLRYVRDCSYQVMIDNGLVDRIIEAGE